jgi:hypothetical protein
VLSCGDTFLIPKSSNQTPHLWILITEPDPITFESVCVNVTTSTGRFETIVTLMPGDHPFIKHESVILFADARKLDTRNIEAALNATSLAVVCKSHSACNPKLLKRIQEGLLLSKTVPRGIKALRPTAKRNGAWRNSEMADHLLDDMD